MKTTPEHDQRIAKTVFAAVWPYYIKKVESKGRTIQELLQVIDWLTGFDEKKLKELIDEKVTIESFSAGHPESECSPDHRNDLRIPSGGN